MGVKVGKDIDREKTCFQSKSTIAFGSNVKMSQMFLTHAVTDPWPRSLLLHVLTIR